MKRPCVQSQNTVNRTSSAVCLLKQRRRPFVFTAQQRLEPFCREESHPGAGLGFQLSRGPMPLSPACRTREAPPRPCLTRTLALGLTAPETWEMQLRWRCPHVRIDRQFCCAFHHLWPPGQGFSVARRHPSPLGRRENGVDRARGEE